MLDPSTERDTETDEGAYIAVDANLYRIRIVHAAFDGFILGTLDAKASEVDRAVRFVQRQTKLCGGTLIGIRHDRWPPGLHAALVQEFGPVRWIPQHILTQTARPLRAAMRLSKFLRATYMVACAWSSSRCLRPVKLERWKDMMLFEFICHLDSSLKPPDEVPF